MKYRMYSFVLRQLNPIQKGVQTTHAVVEYASYYFKTNEYQHWSNIDKTLIMLDGGTYPEMMELLETLEQMGIKHEYFEEEDLNNLTTSIVLLADERVWDREKYPDYDPHPQPKGRDMGNGLIVTPAIAIIPEPYEHWVERMGGESIVKLRELIFSKRLAS